MSPLMPVRTTLHGRNRSHQHSVAISETRRLNCTLALGVNSENELLEAAVRHAVAVHQHQAPPEPRAQLKALLKEGSPPA